MNKARKTPRLLLGSAVTILLFFSLAGSAYMRSERGRDGKHRRSPSQEPAVMTFDTCVKDDDSRASIAFNSLIGSYSFTDGAMLTLTGTGKLKKVGCVITLSDQAGDRRVQAQINNCVQKGKASVITLVPVRLFLITDRNTGNSTCP